jgi:GT2 family glycosyltransferase
MLVSITIAAKNEEKNIEKSLSSALNQSYSPIEIFLIDDTSTDKTVEVAEETYRGLTGQLSGQTPKFTIIRNEKNLGFGGSHNVGMRKSSGDFVLCLNADCELDKNYVKYAVEVFARDPRIAAVQGKLTNPRTGKIDTTGLLFYKNRRVINRGQGDLDRGQYENPEEIWGVDGAAPVYRRVALADTKIRNEYFDEDFFAYKEDIDLSWRLRWAGWKCMYEPKAIAYHDRSAGEGTAKNPLRIIQARRGISQFAKFHSFANQRLTQVKNETLYLFIKGFPKIFVKELMSWPYVLFFEKYGVKSALEFFKLLPRTIAKRRYVMEKRRITSREMEKWFI